MLLTTLSLSDVPSHQGSRPRRLEYTASVVHGIDQTTLTYDSADRTARIGITPLDDVGDDAQTTHVGHAGDVAGHQADLAVHDTTINIAVTSGDATTFYRSSSPAQRQRRRHPWDSVVGCWHNVLIPRSPGTPIPTMPTVPNNVRTVTVTPTGNQTSAEPHMSTGPRSGLLGLGATKALNLDGGCRNHDHG